MGREKNKLKKIELEFFHKQMETLLDSGYPLPKGIRRFARDIRNPKFRRTLYRLSSKLENGESLSDAMSDDKHFFPPDYVAMIRIGEQGGDLRDTLSMVMEHERLQSDFRENVKNVIFYPLSVFFLVCAAYIFTLLHTYPVILDCFRMTGTGIPLIADATRKVFFIAAHYGTLFLLLFIVTIYILRGRLEKPAHELLLKIPFLGRVLTDRFIVFFSEGLAVLLGNGVPIPESMGLLAGITDNKGIASRLDKAEKSAREGAELELLLAGIEVFPELYRSSIHTGLKTGMLPDTLFRLAGVYKSRMEYHATLFLRILKKRLNISTRSEQFFTDIRSLPRGCGEKKPLPCRGCFSTSRSRCGVP